MTSVTRLVPSSQQSLGQDLQAGVAPWPVHIPELHSPSTQGRREGWSPASLERVWGNWTHLSNRPLLRISFMDMLSSHYRNVLWTPHHQGAFLRVQRAVRPHALQ